MAEVGMATKAMAEFIGTFLLVFTVTCNVFTDVPIFAGVSIAFVLMVSIYSLGGISGANFNPAVSLALFGTKLLGDDAGISAAQFGTYVGSQLLGGIAASLASQRVFNDAVPLGPSKKFEMMEAGLCEFFYTFMLCFVVLNVATAKKNGGNQYYGMAIGFVIIAGAYGAGAVSGGCFNPAVAWGLGATTIIHNKSTVMVALVYTACECAGALVAVGAFRMLRPDNFVSAWTVSGNNTTPDGGIMLVSEFLGTFMLVLTVGLNVLVGSKAGAFSIAASLTSMIYALGSVSGAHFNPAVSTAILVSGRDKTFSAGTYCGYMGTQVVAGICAALVYQTILGDSMKLGPQGDYSLSQALVAEFVFTFVLAFVVLSVAVSTTTKSADMFGLAIGGCVTVGGNAIGAVSGGSLNPAVSFGIATGSLIAGGGTGSIMNAFYYTAVDLAAGALAAGVFRVVHMVDHQEQLLNETSEGVSTPLSKCLAEFVGTFLLVFTVASNVLTEVPVFAGVSIAFVLMVSIYSLGGISGANFNPAVSAALALSKALGGPGIDFTTFAQYVPSQLAGGLAANFGYTMLFGGSIALSPTEHHGIAEAGLCELLYTFMLCFVVFNVAVAKNNQPNQYYGLAIGFVIIAGAFGAGAVSGGCFNPAVAIGLSGTFTMYKTYVFCELLGATLAAVLFMLLRSDLLSERVQSIVLSGPLPDIAKKLTSEFLGTFMLVVTVGLNVLVGSKAGAFSIAASLTSMIYALGSVSGAHFNPAVSTAILFSGRDGTFTIGSYIGYMGTQVVAGICAALTYQSILHDSMKLGPKGDYSLIQALIAEFAFTFVLAFVVLSVALSTTTKSADMFGLAIGGCVTVGGNAIGAVSGGSLNPAVSFGIATGSVIAGGGMGSIMNAWHYTAAELAGGFVAAMIFRATHAVDQKEGYANVPAAYSQSNVLVS
eukprot:TRINITY_DN782_c0_g1_i1.p1 TRINITY_DN782_c0_g1~~TRINITY_DN782_c0_g1_i1.p1  ORF type:complete len:935 (-),score=160.70 TRINITY_DN782_c0_g1_i1:191-2995(-)